MVMLPKSFSPQQQKTIVLSAGKRCRYQREREQAWLVRHYASGKASILDSSLVEEALLVYFSYLSFHQFGLKGMKKKGEGRRRGVERTWRRCLDIENALTGTHTHTLQLVEERQVKKVPEMSESPTVGPSQV